MSDQIVTYEINKEKVDLFCRNQHGDHVVRQISLPAKWVWDLENGNPTCKMPKQAKKKRVNGVGLYACTKPQRFVEYTFNLNTPKRHDVGWYNNKLDRYHYYCVENGVPPSGNPKKLGKVPLMCIDIEAMPGPNMEFPRANRDAVLQISAVIDYDVFSADSGTQSHIFALGSLSCNLPRLDEFDPAGVHVHSYDTEMEMLAAFARFVRKVNPDIISGWNINGFDLPYLHDRHETLYQAPPKYGKKNNDMRSFTKKNGVRGFVIHGRIVVDMLDVWRKEHVERSYKLGDIAQNCLGTSKAPVDYDQIRTMQDTEDGRSRMATYCVKDSWLVWKLSKTRKKWTNALEMSNVTFVPLQHVFTRAQQWKVFSLITHYGLSRQPKVFIPSDPEDSEANFQGAVVVDPKPGFYTSCVSTVDFASLYPTIMIAFNMCYTNRRQVVSSFELARSLNVPEAAATRILAFAGNSKHLIRAVPADAREFHRCGHADFRKKNVGLLPQILQTLLKNRKRAKSELKQATSEIERNVLNGKQLALKLCANSLYGFTGTSMELGMLPCPDIASSVTYMGRKLIVSTKTKCEKKFNVTGIYGDTDSVFFHHPGVQCVKTASKLAETMSSYMNKMFPRPIELEFEKVYNPFLLLKKKRYVGNKYDEGKSPPALDAKGVEMVRRDNFPLLPSAMTTCVEHLMKKNTSAALEHVASVFEYVRTEQNLDMSRFIISKELTKPAGSYSAKPPHVVVASRIPHNLHERVQYVVSNALGNVGEKAKHPTEMQNFEVDRLWYAKQLETSLRRLLVHCCDSRQLAETFSSGQENEIVSNGQAPILVALGAGHNRVCRKRRTHDPAEVQAKRQMTLNQFF